MACGPQSVARSPQQRQHISQQPAICGPQPAVWVWPAPRNLWPAARNLSVARNPQPAICDPQSAARNAICGPQPAARNLATLLYQIFWSPNKKSFGKSLFFGDLFVTLRVNFYCYHTQSIERNWEKMFSSYRTRYKYIKDCPKRTTFAFVLDTRCNWNLVVKFFVTLKQPFLIKNGRKSKIFSKMAEDTHF